MSSKVIACTIDLILVIVSGCGSRTSLETLAADGWSAGFLTDN
jgi:hypothetical protein